MAIKLSQTRICLRKDTYENCKFHNPLLLNGETMLVYFSDPQKLCLAIGDGITPFNDLTLYSLEPLKKDLIPKEEKQTNANDLGQMTDAITKLSGSFGLPLTEAVESLKQAWSSFCSVVKTSIAEDIVGKRNSNKFINIMEETAAAGEADSNVQDNSTFEPETALTTSIKEFREYINNLN